MLFLNSAPPSPPHRSVTPTASGSTGLKTPEGITVSLHQSEIVNERVRKTGTIYAALLLLHNFVEQLTIYVIDAVERLSYIL